MTQYVKPETNAFARQLVIMCSQANASLHAQVVSAAEQETEMLALTPLTSFCSDHEIPEDLCVKVYEQQTIKSSRKAIRPWLMTLLARL